MLTTGPENLNLRSSVLALIGTEKQRLKPSITSYNLQHKFTEEFKNYGQTMTSDCALLLCNCVSENLNPPLGDLFFVLGLFPL